MNVHAVDPTQEILSCNPGLRYSSFSITVLIGSTNAFAYETDEVLSLAKYVRNFTYTVVSIEKEGLSDRVFWVAC